LPVIWTAHQKAKNKLINYIYKKQKIKLDPNIFTIVLLEDLLDTKDLIYYL
jgi:hypothetical protein